MILLSLVGVLYYSRCLFSMSMQYAQSFWQASFFNKVYLISGAEAEILILDASTSAEFHIGRT